MGLENQSAETQFHNTVLEGKTQFENMGHELNKERAEISRILSSLSEAARTSLSIDSLPKVMELKVKEKDFVSIRRIEGNEININASESVESPYDSKIRLMVPAKFIFEGSVGILITPSTWRAEPKEGALKESLLKDATYDINEDMGALLPVALSDGIPFKSSEWNMPGMGVYVVTRRGDKFYTLGRYLKYDKNDHTDVFVAVEIKPNADGSLVVGEQGFLWTNEEVSVQKQLDMDKANFYVVVEGSSEKKKNIGEERETISELAAQATKVD